MFRNKRRVILVIMVLLLFVFISLPLSFSRSVRGVATSVFAPVMKLFGGVFHRIEMVFVVIFTSNMLLKKKTRRQ